MEMPLDSEEEEDVVADKLASDENYIQLVLEKIQREAQSEFTDKDRDVWYAALQSQSILRAVAMVFKEMPAAQSFLSIDYTKPSAAIEAAALRGQIVTHQSLLIELIRLALPPEEE